MIQLDDLTIFECLRNDTHGKLLLNDDYAINATAPETRERLEDTSNILSEKLKLLSQLVIVEEKLHSSRRSSGAEAY